MIIKGGRKYLILLIINDCCYFQELTIICVKMCQRCAKLCQAVLNFAQLSQSMSKCAKLCQMIKINLSI